MQDFFCQFFHLINFYCFSLLYCWYLQSIFWNWITITTFTRLSTFLLWKKLYFSFFLLVSWFHYPTCLALSAYMQSELCLLTITHNLSSLVNIFDLNIQLADICSWTYGPHLFFAWTFSVKVSKIVSHKRTVDGLPYYVWNIFIVSQNIDKWLLTTTVPQKDCFFLYLGFFVTLVVESLIYLYLSKR